MQSCRFQFPIEECQNTHIEYERIHSKSGNFFLRPKVILKRNDTRVNKQQTFQLQPW